ncbi:MAG: SDR family NAD(P)-dependent oxidoreductase [Streptosporangiales bacterium]|nr:SDR family NAD(P)-dependent oxidoreductase [Streptosporangiales bacterium]
MTPTGDPVLLVTGASSGIGAATVRRAAAAGYRVVAAARSSERLAELRDELGGPERVLAVTCDVAEWDDQRRMVDEALAAFGRIDVAVANAGVTVTPGFRADTADRWRTMVLTNVYGTALTIRATLDALEASRGHLVLTSSAAGRRALAGSLYGATKCAVTGMGEAARLELNGTGVRVTVIEPGLVDTPLLGEPAAGRLAPDAVASAVLYAVSQPPDVDVNEIFLRPTAQDT